MDADENRYGARDENALAGEERQSGGGRVYADGRTVPPRTADERASLCGYLDFQRDTLALKCAGLTAGQLRERAAAPSSLSLLGLVRHLAEVERGWFRKVVNGEDAPGHWRSSDATPADHMEFDATDADPDEAFAVWRAACARSREITDAAVSLDVLGHEGEDVYSLRYVLIHMIGEYARHNGHADIVREHLDGTTGV